MTTTELERSLPQPNRDRIGALTALILIANALIRVVTLPTVGTELTVLGLIVPVSIDVRVVMLSLAAVLAATGALWVREGLSAVPAAGVEGRPVTGTTASARTSHRRWGRGTAPGDADVVF